MRVNKPLAERLLALLLAGATAFSSVPTAALAEAVEDAVAQSSAAQDAGEYGSAGDALEGAALDVDAAEGDVAEKDAAGSNAGAADQAGAESFGEDGQVSGQSKQDEPASGNASSEDDRDQAGDAGISANSADQASSGQAGEDAIALASDAAATTLTSNAKVYIQSTKDSAYSSSVKSGSLKVGETIYANVFDGTSSYSLKSVPNPGTWTYTWLAGTIASSSNISDYTEEVGHEQALTITADMAGKYLICKVTADGADRCGPSVTYGSGINANYIPGPVLGEGQAELYSVKLDNSAPSVGDTLTATAYTDYSTPAGDDVDVTYTWSYASSRYGTYASIEGATGRTFTVTDAYKGSYLKVTASAGANKKYVTTTSAVLAEGAVTLAGVELAASSTEVGAALTAKAYSGSSHSPTYVDNAKVTYTWKKYKGASEPSSYTTWETIEGASGPSLTVTNDLEGYYVTVVANAGDNDVKFGDYYSGYGVGPFKLAGAVDIYSAILAPAGSTSGSYVYTVDDTVQALAKEKDASAYIDASKLTYQWQVSDAKDGTYADIDGATQSTLSLAAYQGKFVKCVVSSAIGSSAYTTRATNVIAASGSVNVTKVALDVSSKAEAGKKIIATASSSGADVTGSEKVSWSWYWGESGSTCTNKIEGAEGNTLTPDAATYAGKYIQARADGGFGEEKSNAVAVVEAGSVELYGVSVQGAQSSGAVQAGATLTAKATKGNSYTSVDATDTVHYRWQYATAKTTVDASFADIPGAADSATYVVGDAMVGAYIRVIATSENSVKSTQAKSYYGGATSVDPVGPVTKAGQYTLTSVAPAEATTDTLNVGTTLTPKVKIPGSSSWSTSDVPSDAKLTLTWYTSADGKAWDVLTDGVDAETGALTLTDSLAGKYLKVEASALDNTVSWTSVAAVGAAGTYDLLRVAVSPQINSTTTTLVTGDTVAAAAQAKRVDGSSTNGIDVTSKVAFAWYAVDAEGNEALLEGLTGPSIQAPEAAAGKKLKVVATSGDSAVELVSANDVIAKDSLAGAVQQLKASGKSLSVAYSVDGANVNDLLKAQLADLGYADIDVRVKSAKFSATDANATVGISSADDEANGDVDFFFIDPNKYTGCNIDGLRRATVVFELSRDGESVEYAPSKTTEVAWDEAKLQALLDDAAKGLSIGYASGDSAESVTGDVTLPYRAGSAKKFAVTWESSDASAVSVSGYGWSDYAGKVTRFSADRDVTLTATVKLVSGDSALSGAASFAVTVKSDPEKVAAEKAELQAKVDAAFTYDAVTYSGTSDVADKDGLTADLQTPRPATIGVDGKEYSVIYSADTDDVVFNGYKGTVYQPEAGSGSAKVKLTCTVTGKENAEVTASKTLEFTIAPQDADDLARELKLMEAAKAGYAAAILSGQDASSVASDMHAFKKAYLDADGNLAWAYNTADAGTAGSGIVPVELEGYDDMGTQGWRLFKSSDSSVVAHENLLVTQPEYNTEVTVASRLSSEKYARYAERYPDNETYAKLAGQDVAATVTVKGAKGEVKPEVSVTCSVFGVDADGNQQVWAAADSYTLKNGSTAADVSEELFKKTGLTADYGMGDWGWYLNSITSPFDSSLSPSWDAATGRYWQLFVNGKASDLGAGSVALSDGDRIVWAYSAYGDEAPADQLKVTCEVIGRDAGGNQQTWAQPTVAAVAEGATAAQLSEQLFAKAGITANISEGAWGWYLNTLTSPHDESVTLGWNEDTWEYWQLFINGEYAQVGAGSYTLKAGDTVSWVYGSDATMPGHVSATAEVVGVDASGNAETWSTKTVELVEGATAADLSEAFFDAAGIEADYVTSAWGWFLNSITRNGKAYAWDQETGKYWHLYVNGAASSSMASGVTVSSGDKIQWVYEADPTPDPDPDPTPDPGPSETWDSDWSGYNSADHVTNAKVPTADAEEKWSPVAIKDSTDWNTGVSDPVLAGDYLFIAVGNKLLKKNVDTGETVEGGEAVLDGSIDSTSRIVFTDGLILVPLSEGRLEAVNAGTMAKAWVTDALPKGAHGAAQSLSSVTVRDGYAYFGTAEADWSATYGGNLICVRLSDGAVMWNKANETETGYYWSGMAFSGDFGVIADDSGTVKVIDAATGSVVSSLKVADRVRTTVVADGSDMYVVSNDGVLHKLTVGEDGKISEVGKVAFGFSSTSTPVLANGKIIVGGTSDECFTGGYQGKYEYHYGQVAVIDAATLEVEHAVNKADGSYIRQYGYDGGGDVKSCPVVSVQDGETYVYFTSNNEPGCVYRYRVGDDEAEVLYTPSTEGQNYCMASIVVGSDGALYYTNDSGYLFAIKGNGQRLRRFTVTFDANGKDASVPAAQKVREGSSAIEPATVPSCGGYKFLGWYIDAAGTKAWDFSDAVVCDMTLYAKWEKKGSTTPGDDGSGGSGKGDDAAGDAGNGGSGNKTSGGSISFSGNGNNGGSSVKSALDITMSAQSAATSEETATTSILAGFASETLTGSSSGSAADDGELGSASEGVRSVAGGSDAGAGSAGMPIWPFIGIAAAIAAFIVVVATKRREEEE